MKNYSIVGDKLIVSFSTRDTIEFTQIKDFIKALNGVWSHDKKVWILPNNSTMIQRLNGAGFSSDSAIVSESGEIDVRPVPKYNHIELNPKWTNECLRDYQRDAVKFLIARGMNGLIALCPGSGKSLIALTALSHYSHDKPVLIVCPASLRGMWLNEVKKFTKMKAQGIFSTFKATSIRDNTEILVTNYDILFKLQEELLGNIGMIVFDEGHYLANDTAKRTKAALLIAKRIPTIVLTGTPVKNKPHEIFPLLTMIDNKYWSSKSEFYKRYCKMGLGYGGRIVVNGGKNLDELHKRLQAFMFYVPEEVILPQLPEVQDIGLKLELPPDSPFMRANAEIESMIENGNYDKVELLTRLSELSRSAFFEKRSAFYDMVDDYLEETDEKIVIVALHKAVIEDLTNKYKCRKIDGSIPGQNRFAIVQDFHTNSDRVLILQIEAASTGFSILCSRTMFFAEINYSFTTLQQVKARIRRMNSTADRCLYYFLTVAKSVEERMFSLMAQKEGLASEIITGEATTSIRDLSFERLVLE